MDLLELMRQRRSVRAFLPNAVEDEKLLQILEAGRIAPSACNMQPWTFLVINEDEARKKLSTCYERSWFGGAMLHIVIIGDHREAWSRPSGDSVDIDTSIAITQMMLMAQSLGLASTWVCAFDQEKCRELFGIPAHCEAVSILAVGYADEARLKPNRTPRKALDEIVKYNKL
ncbi:nitroreductase family protein [Bacteroides heparinolyticus]|uniref:nitroreductase family protein n=1 Tax=Prevotella heparinolytica TaxID=28113 RepID=UPI0035A07ED4